MARAAALALVLFTLAAGDARAAQQFHVYTANLPIADYSNGAIGLLVPGAGPNTSNEQALRALRSGKAVNSLRGGSPGGPPLIEVTSTQTPPTGPRIFVGLPQGGIQPNDSRYFVVVIGKGYHGLLTSDSTRIPGLVSIADIAPTALGENGALGSTSDTHPAATLRALDARIDDHNDSRVLAGLLAGFILIALALLWPKAGLLRFGAALLANLALGLTEISSFWPTLTVIGLAAAAGGPLPALLLRSDLAIGLFLAGIVAAYL